MTHAAAAHRVTVRDFQAGEEAFVWGQRLSTGAPWHLEDGRAHTDRAMVKADVACPVPGCGAQLTTVARPRGRDGLRHLADTGNHPGESLDHATACLAVESWIRRTHPHAYVAREATTSDATRRADVFATNDAGDAIAVEIQYSPLTPEAWQRRHQDYARQGIVDVWLWGHRGASLAVDRHGRLTPNPAQRTLVDAGMPLLFINPATVTVAIATREAVPLDDDGTPSTEHVTTLDVDDAAHLELRALADFALSPRHGVTSPRLRELLDATKHVRTRDSEIRDRLAAAAATAAAELAAATNKRRLEVIDEHTRIRALLHDVGPGNRFAKSAAYGAVVSYIAADRPPRIGSYEARPGEPPRLLHWQAALYFTFIAGQEGSFTVRQATRALRAAGVKLGQFDAIERVYGYCDFLTLHGYLDRYSDVTTRYTPTPKGAWW